MSRRGGTIYAEASGAGRAAIAVIRLSGPASSAALAALTRRSSPSPRRLALRRLHDPATGEPLDDALVAWFPGPDSFTGEDGAELHLHGGVAVRAAVLEALGAIEGCRPALPGEFTHRAFLNGRLDLAAAEGLADLVDAETRAQHRQALRQLDGALGREVEGWRLDLLDALAAVEAGLDFSDEGDVAEEQARALALVRAAAVRDAVRAALAEGRRGERLRQGFTVVLAGPPNAGKSSLLNALVRREVALVSATPGTTRDAIEVRLDLGGLPVTLIDTAGLRDATDPVEAAGVARARERAASADLVLRLEAPDVEAIGADDRSPADLRVRTKADLSPATSADPATLAVSAHDGTGLPALLDAIEAAARRELGGGAALLTRERHRLALARCAEALDRVLAGAADPAGAELSPELLAEDLRLAVRALGEVTGRVGVEDMLDRLFAGFCIGK